MTRAERGFTLLEMVCVLAIIALLAAVLLPFIPRQTSRSRLQAYALEAATLLKADRDAAISRSISVATLVDAGARAIRSGASRALSAFPMTSASTPCCRRPAGGARRCRPSASSPTERRAAARIALTRFDTSYEVRVNWLTGRVEVVSRDTSIN